MTNFRSLKPFSLILVFCIASACNNPHKQIGGSDIPVVPELTHTATTVSSGSHSRIEDGIVTFEGPIYDALERARWSVANFKHNGWVLEAITGTPEKATATFGNAKPSNGVQRVATLVITADRRNGTAVINFSTRKVQPSSADQPKDSKTDQTTKS